MREDDKATGYQPVDPTTPVLPDLYPYHINEPTTPDLYSGDEISIPPPPPSSKKRRGSLAPLILSVVLAFLLFASAGLFYLARTYTVNKAQPTPIVHFVEVTPTPAPAQQSTPDRNYTATDILHDMQNDGCSCGAEAGMNQSPWIFIGESDNTYNSVQPTSQVAWSDPMQQFDNVGLWVYADEATAMGVYQQLGTDENSSGHPPYTLPALQHVHGRCLLLISGNTVGHPWGGYQQAIDHYCV